MEGYVGFVHKVLPIQYLGMEPLYYWFFPFFHAPCLNQTIYSTAFPARFHTISKESKTKPGKEVFTRVNLPGKPNIVEVRAR